MSKKRVEQWPDAELSGFCSQMAMVLETGMPIDFGLRSMAGEDKDHAEVLKQMAESVEQGQSFEQVLQDSGCFPEYVIQMTRLGSSTGSLDVLMKELAYFYRNEETMTRNISDMFLYPAIMVTIMLMVLSVLLLKVVPLFYHVYEQLGSQPSALARQGMLGLGIVCAVLAVVFLILVLMSMILPADSPASPFQWAKKKILSGAKMKRKMYLSRLSEVFYLLTRSGIPLNDGLKISSPMLDEVEPDMTRKIIESMELGETVDKIMEKEDLYTRMEQSMIAIGFQTGKSEHIFSDLEKRCRQAVENRISQVMNRFEPILVSVMSLGVGVILLYVMFPLIRIMSSL